MAVGYGLRICLDVIKPALLDGNREKRGEKEKRDQMLMLRRDLLEFPNHQAQIIRVL